jgi:hypothetical protein
LKSTELFFENSRFSSTSFLEFIYTVIIVNPKNDVEENLEFSKNNSVDFNEQIESDLKDLD